eukprot:scaffold57294_cov32-Tisochrysis_lutea.AAC.2
MPHTHRSGDLAPHKQFPLRLGTYLCTRYGLLAIRERVGKSDTRLLLPRLASLGDCLLWRIQFALPLRTRLATFSRSRGTARNCLLDRHPLGELLGNLVLLGKDDGMRHTAGDLRHLELLQIVALLRTCGRLLLALAIAELTALAIWAPGDDARVRRHDRVCGAARKCLEVPAAQIVLHLWVHPRVLRG